MDPFRVPFALLAFLAIVAVIPAWMHFVSAYAGNLSIEGRFLVQFLLPVLSLLTLASWLQPR